MIKKKNYIINEAIGYKTHFILFTFEQKHIISTYGTINVNTQSDRLYIKS